MPVKIFFKVTSLELLRMNNTPEERLISDSTGMEKGLSPHTYRQPAPVAARPLMYPQHNGITFFFFFFYGLHSLSYFFSHSMQVPFSFFFNTHNSASCDTGMKKRSSLGGGLTQHICYSSHQATFLSGRSFLVVATNCMKEKWPFAMSFGYSTY